MLNEKSISCSFFNALEKAAEFEVLSVDCEALFKDEAVAPPLSAMAVFVMDPLNQFPRRLFSSPLVRGILSDNEMLAGD
jgi:hypothetical protein